MGAQTYLERYLDRSGAIDWDPDRFGPIDVDRTVANVVWSLACIETDSTSQASKIERAGFTRAPDVGSFLPHWYEEEQEHGRFLFAVARASGIEPPGSARLSTDADQAGQPPGPMLAVLGRIPGADVAYLVTAAAAEYTARFMYSWLGDEFAGTPVVARHFKDLAAQEARHLGFYRSAAEARLDRSRLARRFGPIILRRYWRPVGIDTLGWDRWFDTFGPMVTDPRFQHQLVGIDRLVTALPGFADTTPMRSFLADHDLLLAA